MATLAPQRRSVYAIAMVSVFDVAAYILKEMGPLSAMKLQKLVYYSQAWSLVWDGEPLFREKIQAWANGPVVYDLFRAHRGHFTVTRKDLAKGDWRALSRTQRDTVDSVLKFYGDKSPQWLSDLTHMEKPWQKARRGLLPEEPGSKEITLASMAGYYESLPAR